jgi:hypothetical protein
MKRVLRCLLFLVLSRGGALAAPPVVNIQYFGAVPDDGVDDSAAIQAAFDALDPAQGGTVFCPPGTYEVSTPIIVRTSAVRFAGAAGPSYNEDPPYAGCTLVARTDGMTLLQFRAGSLNHRGPLIEYVNLRDRTPSGHSATLLDIKNFNRWTVRNVTVNYANTGLKVTGDEDASWGYVSQLFCKESNTCIDQSTVEGGFLVLGGGFEPAVAGIRVRGSQVRIVGAKFDCAGGSIGVHITGHAAIVTASMFEDCGTGILVRNDGTQRWNGNQNSFIGNHFIGWKIQGSRGISLGPTCTGNHLIGNTYEYPAVAVEDLGTGTLRLEQGAAADLTLVCPKGQAVRALKIQQGIVTDATCGEP